MSAVVVLGGADGSLGTLRTARALCHRAICVDIRTDAPGARLADELLNLATRDIDRLLGAVVSSASDVNLPTQYALAQALGLPCGLSPRRGASATTAGRGRDHAGRRPRRPRLPVHPGRREGRLRPRLREDASTVERVLTAASATVHFTVEEEP